MTSQMNALTEFISQIDFKVAKAARQDLERLYPDRDSTYRIFHRSFKMYRLAGRALYCVEKMLAPLGFVRTPGRPETIITELERWQADPLFVDFVRYALDTQFTMDRNEPSAWREDATKLAAACFVCEETARGTLDAFIKMSEKKGVFWDDDFLDDTDALLIEVLQVLRPVRGRMKDETRAELRTIIENRIS